MIKHYLTPMATSLWEMNGKVGKVKDYEGLVLNGFPKSNLIKAGYAISNVIIQANQSKFFIQNPSNHINSTLFGC